MTSENFENAQSGFSNEHQTRNKKMGDAAGETFARASDMARDAAEKAKRAAADTAATMSDHLMGILNEQLGAGATSASQFASSMRVAADDLERDNPKLADLVRGISHNVDEFADRFGDKTVEDLARDAGDLTRRQPALVFGLAAIAGFFAFRTFKTARSISSPPIQPTHQYSAGERHG